VLGLHHRHPGGPFSCEPLDLTDAAALSTLFQCLRPDAVIHAAACSRPNACEQDPDGSYAINVTATQHLAELCAQAAIPLVFTSTDQVFKGDQAPYDEASPVNPINVYGQQKAAAEAHILAIHPEAVVCRMPLMFGPAVTHSESFLQGWLRTLQAGDRLFLFTDEVRTPVSITDAVAGLLLALAHPGTGRLHLGGRERISRYDFGRLLAETWQIPLTQLHACRQAAVPMPAPRPADVSLNSEKAYALGYQPASLRTALAALKPQAHL
jgi:dTDP-4-dehydrorhamnose reductase